MKLIFTLLACFFLFVPVANANGVKAECSGPGCECFLKGNCNRAHGNPECLVTIMAPTVGGEHFLDFRDANRKSLMQDGKPFKKTVGPGTYVQKVNCSRFKEPMAEVYLCVDGTKGGNGGQYSSVRLRASGHFDTGTRQLLMCLGPDCPGQTHGSRPPIEAP